MTTISRRTMLRGFGVSLGLPWLEAMMPRSARAASQAPKDPVRMAMLYMPNGVNTAHWSPEGTGRDFKLSPTLQPLASPLGPCVWPTISSCLPLLRVTSQDLV